MKKVIILLCLLFSQFTYSQVSDSTKIQNPRSLKKFGLGLQFMGPTLIGSVYVNFFPTHNLNLELGTGLIGTYGGAKLFYGKKDRRQTFSPYTGFNLGTIKMLDPLSIFYVFGGDLMWKRVYTGNIPFGMQIMAKNGFHFSLEGSYMFIWGSTTDEIPFKFSFPWAAIKIGKNF